MAPGSSSPHHPGSRAWRHHAPGFTPTDVLDDGELELVCGCARRGSVAVTVARRGARNGLVRADGWRRKASDWSSMCLNFRLGLKSVPDLAD
jgi:hypothetical protein